MENAAKVYEMKANKVKDEEFETRLEDWGNKKKLNIIAQILGLCLVGAVSIAAIGFTFWAYWWYKTELDVLYLVSYYAIFGSFLNAVVMCWIGSMIRSVRKAGLRNIVHAKKVARIKHYNKEYR